MKATFQWLRMRAFSVYSNLRFFSTGVCHLLAPPVNKAPRYQSSVPSLWGQLKKMLEYECIESLEVITGVFANLQKESKRSLTERVRWQRDRQENMSIGPLWSTDCPCRNDSQSVKRHRDAGFCQLAEEETRLLMLYVCVTSVTSPEVFLLTRSFWVLTIDNLEWLHKPSREAASTSRPHWRHPACRPSYRVDTAKFKRQISNVSVCAVQYVLLFVTEYTHLVQDNLTMPRDFEVATVFLLTTSLRHNVDTKITHTMLLRP